MLPQAVGSSGLNKIGAVMWRWALSNNQPANGAGLESLCSIQRRASTDHVTLSSDRFLVQPADAADSWFHQRAGACVRIMVVTVR
jgi:hypothetical protein